MSFRTGIKYRYEKGTGRKDSAHYQPSVRGNTGCPPLKSPRIVSDRPRITREWNGFRDGKFVWADMIKRDIDACIMQAATYESFLEMLSGMGYEIKNAYRSEGKYLAIKPMGLTRFRRCKSLGEDYTEERIRERIETENLSTYRSMTKEQEPKIMRCRVKRYKGQSCPGYRSVILQGCTDWD